MRVLFSFFFNRVLGSGLRLQFLLGLGFRVEGSVFLNGVLSSGSRLQFLLGPGFRVQGSVFFVLFLIGS